MCRNRAACLLGCVGEDIRWLVARNDALGRLGPSRVKQQLHSFSLFHLLGHLKADFSETHQGNGGEFRVFLLSIAHDLPSCGAPSTLTLPASFSFLLPCLLISLPACLSLSLSFVPVPCLLLSGCLTFVFVYISV